MDGVPLPDSAIWFGVKLIEIITMISQWQQRIASYLNLQKMLDLELKGFNEMRPYYHSEAYTLSRRQAIVSIATLPIALLTKIHQGGGSATVTEEFLSSCAASITACWHLSKGNELASVEHVLPKYVPTLASLAQQPSKYQQDAASLAAQGYLLLGLLALHRLQLTTRKGHCLQAVKYCQIAKDPNLKAIALMHLGSTYYYSGKHEKTLQTHQEALSYSAQVSPLVRARIFIGLAEAHGYIGQKQEALGFLGQAHDIFSEDLKDDPSSLFADFGFFALLLWGGLTYLDLGEHYPNGRYYQQAWSTFSLIEEPATKIIIPERTRVEIVNHLAMTAVKTGNMEGFHTYLIEGVNGAKALQSDKRRQEAVANWKEARKEWPRESQILELADLLL